MGGPTPGDIPTKEEARPTQQSSSMQKVQPIQRRLQVWRRTTDFLPLLLFIPLPPSPPSLLTLNIATSSSYKYTTQLLELDKCTPADTGALTPPLLHIQTPANIRKWERALSNHPDQQCARYIVQGLTYGFRIGFQYAYSRPQVTCQFQIPRWSQTNRDAAVGSIDPEHPL